MSKASFLLLLLACVALLVTIVPLSKRDDDSRRRRLFGLSSPFPGIMIRMIDPKSTTPKDTPGRSGSSKRQVILEVSEAQVELARYADDAAARGETTYVVSPLIEEEGDEGGGDADAVAGAAFDPAGVRVRVVNPKLGCRYSVTFTSHDKYTGSASLVAAREDTDTGGGAFSYEWRPVFPGRYDVHVHEIRTDGSSPSVQPRSYPVFVDEGPNPDVGIAALEMRLRSPPCADRPNGNIYYDGLYSNWDGDWLGPDFNLDEALRTGWTFLPKGNNMNCRIESYTRDDLKRIPGDKKLKRIHIYGNDVTRGVFLSLVDLMLEPNEKEEFERSIVGECAGRMTVSKGMLAVAYKGTFRRWEIMELCHPYCIHSQMSSIFLSFHQKRVPDFRPSNFEGMSKDHMGNLLPYGDPEYVCHNEFLISSPEDQFILNATKAWQGMWSNSKEMLPDVIMMGWNFGNFAHDDAGVMKHAPHDTAKWEEHIAWFVKRIPPTWDGTLLITDNSLSGSAAGLASSVEYASHLAEIKRMLSRLGDRRVRWIDGHGLSKEMRMHGGNGEDRMASTQRLHSFCHGNGDGAGDVAVCSNVTELVGQVLLGHAIGPKRDLLSEERWMSRKKTQLRWCHACPKCGSSMPYRLDISTKMTCHDGPLTAAEPEDCATDARAFTMCPEMCLKTPWTGEFAGPSNMVHVRRCPV